MSPPPSPAGKNTVEKHSDISTRIPYGPSWFDVELIASAMASSALSKNGRRHVATTCDERCRPFMQCTRICFPWQIAFAGRETSSGQAFRERSVNLVQPHSRQKLQSSRAGGFGASRPGTNKKRKVLVLCPRVECGPDPLTEWGNLFFGGRPRLALMRPR